MPAEARREPGEAAVADHLDILYPPTGAILDRATDPVVPLRAAGGQRPLQWLIDGQPIESTPYRREAAWQPTGPGYFRATVIDARGVGSTVEFRVR